MNATIISIGDELLIGQVIDTNSAWMARELNNIGISIVKKWCIADDEIEITETLTEASLKSDIVIITGGLGPTKDDITKSTLVTYFDTELELNTDAYENVKRIFAKSKRSILERNKEQAMLPKGCIPLPNSLGTAYGMGFEKGNKIYFSMPGVPFEMKAMMSDIILPMLVKKYDTEVVYHKTILTQGAGESALAEAIEQWENELPKHIKLAYLPKPGIVRLRLSAKATNADIKKQVEEQIEKVKPLIGDLIYGFDNDSLEETIGQLLISKDMTLSTAESCTGGNIARMITTISGSSTYFKGSVVSYANEVKQNLLKVKAEDLEKVGAVSEEVVVSMALEIRSLLNTDYSIASSGIAGPGGGNDEKPVGTVWLAVAGPNGVNAKKFQFTHNRERNIEISSLTALNMLRKELISKF